MDSVGREIRAALMGFKDKDTLILRLADGLDRSHHQFVTGVVIDERDGALHFDVVTQGDAELEVWGARRKGNLLERELGRSFDLCMTTPTKAASA